MTVKHRQLAPTVGPDFDDLLANSMASLNLDSILEKGTTLSFGDWFFVANGSGGFTSNLTGEQDTETPCNGDATAQDNSPAPVDATQDLPEDPQEDENFDLIKKY